MSGFEELIQSVGAVLGIVAFLLVTVICIDGKYKP